jgi:hypothetical protein
MGKLQEEPHPALQIKKFLNFFLSLWVIFALLDPDPDSESGSNGVDSGQDSCTDTYNNYLSDHAINRIFS